MSSDSAIAAYWNFFESFNSRDGQAFSAALNYPHVRVSSRGTPAIVPSLDDHAASMSWQRVLATGWDHTNGHEPELLHEAEDRAHIVGGWTRVDAQDKAVLVNRVTYIVTRTDAGWGIQCRFGTDAGTAQSSGETEAAHARAVALVEDYIDAYNDRDWQQCASLMATPHSKWTWLGARMARPRQPANGVPRWPVALRHRDFRPRGSRGTKQRNGGPRWRTRRRRPDAEGRVLPRE